MSIRFVCRNGHVLKADVRHAGRKTHCPRCQVVVWETRIASWADEPGGGAGADRDRAGEEGATADWNVREPDDECFGPVWDADCGKDA